MSDNVNGYTVEITFSGLCPFIPGGELSPDPNQQPPWVGCFLVNASAANAISFNAADLPAHFPLLKFDSNALVGMEQAPETSMLLPLRFVDIVFVPPEESPKGLRVNFAGSPGEIPVTGEVARLFNWITPLEDVMSGRGQVDPVCYAKLDTPIEPVAQRVAARIHMVRGTLQARSFGRIRDQVVVVELGGGGSKRRSAVAKTAQLIMECSPGPFRIRMKKFKVENGEDPGMRELVFRQPAQGTPLQIEISNLCNNEIFPTQSQDADPKAILKPDNDFRWNYLISQGVNDLKVGAVPQPVDLVDINPAVVVDPDNGGGGADGAQCSPPRSGATGQAVEPMLDIVNAMTS